MKQAIFALLAVFAAASAHAQVYKCVGADGKTVYSQNPCPANTKSETMSRRAAPAASAEPAAAGDAAKDASKAAKSGAPKTAAEQEQAYRKRQMEQQEAQKKEGQKLAESKEREETCTRARAQLAQYEAGGRISRMNEKGEREYLDDNQYAQEKARAQSLVTQWCK